MPYIQSDWVKTIHICVNCSEVCGGKYCNNCGTAEQRKKMVDENTKIKVENLANGFKYAEVKTA
jgi:hypothetical protein